MPSSEGLSGTRLAWRASSAGESVLIAQGYRTQFAGSLRIIGHIRALLGPVRAAEHEAQPLVQRVADLVQRADPVDGGTVGWREPASFCVVQAAPDVTDRDQLDPAGVDEAQAPVGGDDDPVEVVQSRYFQHVFERADLL